MHKILIAFLMLAVISLPSMAVPVMLQWTPPTEYENGEPLPPEHITSYTVYSNSGVHQTTDAVIIFEVEPGRQCFFVTVQAINGLSSGMGLPGSYICKDVPSNASPGVPIIICN